MIKRISRLVGALMLVLSFALALVVVPAPQATAAKSNNEIGYDFFVSKGLKGYQSAGVIGNLIQESGNPINPKAVQSGGPGRGIAQWSVGERWSNLIAYAQRRGQSRYSLDLQLNFIWYELNRASYLGLSDLKNSRSLPEATRAFQDKFERCNPRYCDLPNRIRQAESVYAKYNGGSSSETSLPTLKFRSTGSAVRTMQYLLYSEGYRLDVDSKFGKDTRKYVRRFQAARGLKADGVVGDKTWDKLLPTLKKGSKNPYAVRALQRELRAEGYKIKVDNKFGDATKSAVMAYQNKKRLYVDGVVGPDTWGSLID